jgi:hypothetical protein
MAAKPLVNERRPTKPIQPWVQPRDTYIYKVRTGDSWLTLGAQNNHQFGEHYLIWINFGLNGTEHFYSEQVNWYLREYVGCRQSLDGGRNWAFTDDASPGNIFLPFLTYNMDAIAIGGKPSVGGVSAPGYNDKNAYDTISKALDIYGMADMGISVSEIPLAALLEGGMIVTGAIAAIFGPLVALGAPYDAALKARSRQHFFTSFCSTFVMAADGWPAATVSDFYPQKAYAPTESFFPEKGENFRKLYNFGLTAGRLQGSRLNTVDRKNLFLLLRSKLKDSEARDYSGDVKQWSRRKQIDYYDRLGSILKQAMLDNDLQITLR